MKIEDIDRDLLPLPGKSGPVGQSSTMNERLSLTVQSLRDLTYAIKEANGKNDRQQRWFLFLAIISTIFAATGIIQAWDILVRGIGK